MVRNRGRKKKDRLLDSFLKRVDSNDRAELLKQFKSDSEVRCIVTDLLELGDYDLSGWENVISAARELAAGIIDSAIPENGEARGVITYDSKLLPMPEGVRRASVDSRRIKVQVGDGRIAISLYPVTPKSYRLMGQLNDFEDYVEILIILRISGKKLETTCNEWGLFEFPRVPCGKCEIILKQKREFISTFELTL